MTVCIGSADAIRAALACGASACPCARSRRRTHCPAHADQTPSLDVDDRRGRVLVICRAGCAQTEILAALSERGLWPGADSTRSIRPRSVTEIALDLARGQAWARPVVLDLYRASDFVRVRRREAERVRHAATLTGDRPETWEALHYAARLDRAVLAVEAGLDELLAMGRPS